MANSSLRYDHDYYSDLHKEVYGVRPRCRLTDYCTEQWDIDAEIGRLHEQLADLLDETEHIALCGEEEARWASFTAAPTACAYEMYE